MKWEKRQNGIAVVWVAQWAAASFWIEANYDGGIYLFISIAERVVNQEKVESEYEGKTKCEYWKVRYLQTLEALIKKKFTDG